MAQCPECRAQWRAHREMLAGLSGAEAPQLSPGFNARLMRRLERESAPAPARTWPWLALRLYVIAAALLSLFILARLDWSWVPALTPAGRVACVLGLLATPLVALFDLPWPRRLASASSAG
jgi:anti-sigma factor RsiW